MAEGRGVFDNEIVTAAGSVCPAKRPGALDLDPDRNVSPGSI
jgi:hypothetical protein